MSPCSHRRRLQSTAASALSDSPIYLLTPPVRGDPRYAYDYSSMYTVSHTICCITGTRPQCGFVCFLGRLFCSPVQRPFNAVYSRLVSAGNDRSRVCCFLPSVTQCQAIGRCVTAGILVGYHPCLHPTLVRVLPTCRTITSACLSSLGALSHPSTRSVRQSKERDRNTVD